MFRFDATALAHVPVALGIQLAGWAIGRRLGASHPASAWMGFYAATAACVMREVTQREYQWIEAYGRGRRANMPDYEGLKIWEWNTHSVAETIVAVAVSAGIATIVSLRARR